MSDEWFRLLAWQRPIWLPIVGRSPRVILSCQVSISRNLHGINFPPFPENSESAGNVRQILLSEIQRIPGWSDGQMLDPTELKTFQRLFLFEQGHFPGSFCLPRANSFALLHPNEHSYCYVNDRDHLRISSWGQDLELTSAHAAGAELIDALEGKLTFAKNDHYGYLCRDANLCGAGTKLEVFLHLPALKLVERVEQNNKIEQLNAACEETGFLLYNMPHCPDSTVFIVGSNHIAPEEVPASIEKISKLAQSLADCELQERRHLIRYERVSLLDTVDRAFGLAKHARQMQFEEFQHCLSALWLGQECEMFQHFDSGVLLDMFGAAGLATITMQQNHRLDSKSWSEENCARQRVKILRHNLQLPDRPES